MNEQNECGARITLHNGETVTPCHKEVGHADDHEGWLLGSRAFWSQDTPDGETVGEEPGSGW
jgi:hypothetical protein